MSWVIQVKLFWPNVTWVNAIVIRFLSNRKTKTNPPQKGPRQGDYDVSNFWITKIMKLAHVHILEHTLFKNVSNRVTFLWQTQIQTIEYGLNDTKRITKNQVTLILYSSTPFDMIFQTILMPKVIFANFLSKKNSHLDHYYLRYSLSMNPLNIE